MKLAYEQGQSYAQIGKTFGLSRMSVWRRLKGHIEAKKTLTTQTLKFLVITHRFCSVGS